MTALNSKVVAAAIAFATLLALIAWIAGFFTAKVDPELIAAQGRVIDESRLYTVKKMSPDRFDDIPATIVARDNTIVASRILSTVKEVNVRAGDMVDAGDVLLVLDEADLRSRVEQAREQVNSATAQLGDAEQRLRRVRELREQAMVSQSELDAAQSAFDSLTARLAQAKQALSEAEIVLSYATIRAPIDGRVIERRVEPGDTVSPGASLVALYDPTSLRVEAAVPEQVALGLEIGEKINISIPSLDQKMAGVIEEVVPAADSASRTFQVKAAIGVAPRIRPGMFARFHIPLDAPAIVTVPQSSITRVGQLDMVEVRRDDGRVERRFVRLGSNHPQGDLVEVLSGLEAGEQILRFPDT
ncbi:MAG: efflux RND transporter periplasmic adaptor subunit [Gammaproteobacteria bacterium]|nr:efflux RND transporter periplasmic adaptor subunit [Gammaproteobacteria bacterium]